MGDEHGKTRELSHLCFLSAWHTMNEIRMDEKAVELYSRELAVYDGLADFILDNNGREAEGVANLTALINKIEKK